ncbi:MAG TPA: hypothetical protein VEL07_10265 [Planctomycetota bacterium]|nr:hypothetical protein [Planctomycetota bacterium]
MPEPLAMRAIEADTAFPGGNGLIAVGDDGDDLVIRPDHRDTDGSWFYWCVRLRGAAGRRVRVRLAQADAIAAHGPALSLDGGRTWSWLGRGCVLGDGFAVDIPAGAAEAQLSMGMPYGLRDWRAAVADAPQRQRLAVETLCRTRAGRDVPLARVAAAGPVRRQALVTARHHACEMMAGYVVEGFVAAALAADAPPGLEILAVPFVDLDGVEAGDQGKNRRPHDHARDYAGDRPLYPECAALKEIVRSSPALAVIDLHCPWISGPGNEAIYQVGLGDERRWRDQRAFAATLARANRSPLPYAPVDDIPYGVGWNVAANYGAGRSLIQWSSEQPAVRLATTIEIPYALARGAAVDQASARAFGIALHAAVVEHDAAES